MKNAIVPLQDILPGSAVAVVALISATLLAGCSRQTASRDDSSPRQSSPVVAFVDSIPVPSSLYALFLDLGMRALNLDESKSDDRRQIDQLKEGIVLNLIDKELLRQEAARRGIGADEKRIEQQLVTAIESLGGRDRFDSMLRRHSLTIDDYRAMLRLEETRSLMSVELSAQAEADPAEIQRYYADNSHRAEFQMPERARAGRILMAARASSLEQNFRAAGMAEKEIQSAVAAKLEERRKFAEEIRRRLALRGNFAQLAKQYSDDAASRSRGGEMGWIEQDEAEAKQQLFLFKVRVGGITNVIRTDEGFEIFKVWEHQPKRVQSIQEAGPDIAKVLLERKRIEMVGAWLQRARARARIEVAVAYQFGDIPARFPPR